MLYNNILCKFCPPHRDRVYNDSQFSSKPHIYMHCAIHAYYYLSEDFKVRFLNALTITLMRTVYTHSCPTSVYYATIEDADDVNCILLHRYEFRFKLYYRRTRWTSFSSYMFLNGYITGSNDEVSTACFFY